MTKLVAIVGPTASGKSSLALEVAKLFSGEIICADSRTLYRGLDIGTAKPTKSDQSEVPHHLLDVINPDQTYSAAQFKVEANRLITEIHGRGHLPILVGGSGLYVYGVLYDYTFPAGANNRLRSQLEQLSTEQLIERLESVDPETLETIDQANRRRLIRAIETAGLPKDKAKLRADSLVIGLKPTQEVLVDRIDRRTEAMIKAGLIDEIKSVIEIYGRDLEALKSPGYSEVTQMIDGQIDLAQMTELISLHTRQLAKRQLTWFKRNPDIEWFEDRSLAEQRVKGWLAD